jgi:phage repressor protein C with HTH and peptisase S24 domain
MPAFPASMSLIEVCLSPISPPICAWVSPAFRKPEIVKEISMEPIMGTPVISVNRFSGFGSGNNIGMSIGTRLKQARKVVNLTQVELATRSGLKQSTISDLEVGKSQGTTYVASLAAALGVNPLWLETGKGSMGPDERLSHEPFDDTGLEDNPFLSGALPVRAGEEPDTIPIRRVKLRLRAGVAGYETEPEMEDGGVLNMPRRIIDKNNFVPHQLLAVTVKGCSMEPLLFEDDVVVINTADKKPANRELFAVNFNGEACVKQLWKDGNQWFLRSLHPDHKPINVRSGQCDIVGRVVYQPGRELTGRL